MRDSGQEVSPNGNEVCMILPGSVSDERVWEKIQGESIQCVVTSPPYWGLRDYGIPGQLGLEKTPEEYVANMVEVFRFIWKKLRKDGVIWLNLGDSYYNYRPGGVAQSKQTIAKHNGAVVSESAKRGLQQDGLKEKDLCMIPARVALALQADGWYLRSEIVWFKRNPMPESVTDRPTKAHEMIYLLTKSPKYYYDQEAVRVPQKESSIERAHYSQIGFNKSKSASGTVNYINNPNTIEETQRKAIEGMGANLKTVWDIPTQSFNGAHFATFPEKIPELCIKAGTSEKGACSKCGSPWVRVVAKTNPLRSLNKGRNGFRPDEIKMEADKGASSAGCVDVKTLGWKPSCKCGGYFVQSDSSRRIEKHSWYRSHWQERVAAKFPPTVPCIVFDPFAGSGTTLRVAKRMNRDFVGIELNPKYITDLIEPSLAEINPLGLK